MDKNERKTVLRIVWGQVCVPNSTGNNNGEFDTNSRYICGVGEGQLKGRSE